MISLNSVRVKKLKRRLPAIEGKFDEDVAIFMLTVLDKESRPWMWKKHEIFAKGGEAAWRGFCKLATLDLADYWRIDNVYVIAGELYALDFEGIAMKIFGYKIKPTEDGGYWLYRYHLQVGYYRKYGMAKRRALKDLIALKNGKP